MSSGRLATLSITRAFPILLQPKVYGLFNYLRNQAATPANRLRDAVILLLALGTMYGIYAFTHWSLVKLEEFSQVVYFTPSIPFSIILLMLFVMLLISNSISAIGALYLSSDSERVLAAPISRYRFFFDKIILIAISTSWMPLVFLIPFLSAYGLYYGTSPDFYLLSFLLLIPFFLIPSCIAVIFSTIFLSIVPVSRTKELLLFALVLLLLFVFGVTQLISVGLSAKSDVAELLRMLSVVSFPDQLWLPSHWVAIGLREGLDRGIFSVGNELLIVYSFLFALAAATYIIFNALFDRAFSQAYNNQQRQVFIGKRRKFSDLLSRIPSHYRAIFQKEYRVFFRDMSQVVQLLLLAGVYLIYLYNLRVFRVVDVLPIDQRAAWQAFLFVANSAMAAFITTAATTRLVFPSISLEGRSFWVLQTSPVKVSEIIRLKFWFWIFPIGLLTSVVMTTGALIVGADNLSLMVIFLASWCTSFGIAGLGVGLGALFANFEWEHASQLAASFGSFVFMLLGIVVIAINMLPVGLVVYWGELGGASRWIDPMAWYLFCLLCAVFLVSVNILIRNMAFDIGAERLSTALLHGQSSDQEQEEEFELQEKAPGVL